MNERLEVASRLAALLYDHNSDAEAARKAINFADALIAREAATRPLEVEPEPITPPRRVLLGPHDATMLVRRWHSIDGEPAFHLTIAGDVVQKVEVAE